MLSFTIFYKSRGHNSSFRHIYENAMSSSITPLTMNAFQPLGKSPPPLGSIRVDSTTKSKIYGGNGDKKHLGGWTG